MFWVENRDLTEQSAVASSAADAGVWLLIHTAMCVPISPCVTAIVKSCFAKLHQHDLFDLLTTHTINDFFFSPLHTQPCSLILLPCYPTAHFPLIPVHHSSFSVLSLLSLFPTFLSPSAFFPSSCLLPIHVISFISFVFFPPNLPLHTPLSPSLSSSSPSLWQAAHCSESVSWRQAAGLPQRWGVQH